MSTPQSTKEIFCNFCKRYTNHICKGQSGLEYGDGSEWINYSFLICAGCGRGTLEEAYTGDWLENPNDGTYEYKYEYFPPRNHRYFEPKFFKNLPQKLTGIYEETLSAVNNRTMILGAIGIRTLLEGICADKNVEGKNLEIKINNLSGILPQNIITNLHSMRFLGNEAAHELTMPSYPELSLAVEICEDLLNFIYELDYKANNLTKLRNQRQNPSDKSP